MEIDPELSWLSSIYLDRHFGDSREKRITIIEGDGSGGYDDNAPYDRIYLTAGVERSTFNPSKLIAQLKDHGVILYPEKIGSLIRQDYNDNMLVNEASWAGVYFNPLRGKYA